MIVNTSEAIEILFPGEGLAFPSDNERDEADALLLRWATQWSEPVVTVARVHSDGTATNRAYLRSVLKRWFAKK